VSGDARRWAEFIYRCVKTSWKESVYMTLENDTLTITQCPKCKKTHKYRLEIRRSRYSSFTSFSNSTKQQVTRLLTCPYTGEDFQASFWITEKTHTPILSVEIKGLTEEANNDTE
jgi:hypothetical protein